MPTVINGKFSIQLYVRDLEKAADWYCKHLGFTMGPHDYNDFVELHLNGRHVMHLLKDTNASPLRKPSFHLDTDDIHNAYLSLKEKGVTVSELVERSDHSGFQFTDVEGNMIGISHFPG
ncbi:VOC family protein [Paenibacillus alkalitolerans]|uniref:VOC family protein n=1 Tax=Paenibacillus alkalitolerans TaxID=2799335 RepID=UPI0018F71E57|nr:VOC family protein [Paenibacillus alkalitolerans]